MRHAVPPLQETSCCPPCLLAAGSHTHWDQQGSQCNPHRVRSHATTLKRCCHHRRWRCCICHCHCHCKHPKHMPHPIQPPRPHLFADPLSFPLPEHNTAPCKGLHTVGSAVVVDQCPQRVYAHTQWPQLIITYGVVVAGKASQQQSDLPDVLWICCCCWWWWCGCWGGCAVLGWQLLLLVLGATQHELPAPPHHHPQHSGTGHSKRIASWLAWTTASAYVRGPCGHLPVCANVAPDCSRFLA